jgi:hypothetical protein
MSRLIMNQPKYMFLKGKNNYYFGLAIFGLVCEAVVAISILRTSLYQLLNLPGIVVISMGIGVTLYAGYFLDQKKTSIHWSKIIFFNPYFIFLVGALAGVTSNYVVALIYELALGRSDKLFIPYWVKPAYWILLVGSICVPFVGATYFLIVKLVKPRLDNKRIKLRIIWSSTFTVLLGLILLFSKEEDIISDNTENEKIVLEEKDNSNNQKSKYFVKSEISEIPDDVYSYRNGLRYTYENNKFEIIGIDWEQERVAFKHSFTRLFQVAKELEERESDVDFFKYVQAFNCDYQPLANKYPVGSGQVIVVYDINLSKIEKYFEIYQSALERNNCSQPELSRKKMLEAQNYLDKYKFIKPDQFKLLTSPYKFKIEKQGREFNITTRTSRATAQQEEELWEALKANDDDRAGRGFTLGEVLNDGILIYRRRHLDYFALAARTEISFPQAFLMRDKIIFLEQMIFNSGGHGSKPVHWYSLSPVINL